MDPLHGPPWNKFAGADTLLSYGVRPPRRAPVDIEAWEVSRRALANALPQAHLSFLRSLELFVERGGYFFVHAGIDPSRPADSQDEAEYLWIRDTFLQDDRKLSHIIVHGHTPEPMPVADRRRVGTDTGAYASGVLTAARIDDDGVRFLST